MSFNCGSKTKKSESLTPEDLRCKKNRQEQLWPVIREDLDKGGYACKDKRECGAPAMKKKIRDMKIIEKIPELNNLPDSECGTSGVWLYNNKDGDAKNSTVYITQSRDNQWVCILNLQNSNRPQLMKYLSNNTQSPLSWHSAIKVFWSTGDINHQARFATKTYTDINTIKRILEGEASTKQGSSSSIKDILKEESSTKKGSSSSISLLELGAASNEYQNVSDQILSYGLQNLPGTSNSVSDHNIIVIRSLQMVCVVFVVFGVRWVWKKCKFIGRLNFFRNSNLNAGGSLSLNETNSTEIIKPSVVPDHNDTVIVKFNDLNHSMTNSSSHDSDSKEEIFSLSDENNAESESYHDTNVNNNVAVTVDANNNMYQ